MSCLSAHVRQNLSWALAGILELSQVPHDLNKVVPRVFVVSAAGVRFSQIVAPVGAPVALARHPELRVISLARNYHGAHVSSLVRELDGILPDVLPPASIALRLSVPEAAG